MTAEAIRIGAGNPGRRGWLADLNGRYHRNALRIFLVIVLGHWAEHIAQAYQIWVLHRPVPKARGVLGEWYPWLIKSEWLHYGYAITMLVFLFLLWPGFVGRARLFWTIALVIQFWHHIEHLLLLIQAQSHTYYFHRKVPTSILQIWYPRVQVHLVYNTIVFIPMAIAMYLHARPPKADRDLPVQCTCAGEPERELVGAGVSGA
jgi:hypothetical protein